MRLRIENTTEEECRAYAKALETTGFCLHEQKEIWAGNKYAGGANLFYTYYKADTCVYLFWDASIYTVFITAEPLGVLPNTRGDTPLDNTGGATLTQLPLKNRGMGYVVRLADGRFILVDGGDYDEASASFLYAFLKENTTQEIPTVALWIFTHSHSDHIRLAGQFVVDYKEKVEVCAFAYQFPDCDKISVAMESEEQMKADIEGFEKNLKESYPNAATYTLHTGQSYYFDGLEIEILYSPDDTYPAQYTSFNDTSVALRLRFASGKTALLLGDCMHGACRRIAHTYGEYLKSDILQVTHHGLIGGDTDLYALIDPEICLWSTSEERFLGKTPNQKYQWCLGEGCCDYNRFIRDESIRKRTHYPASETTTIKL